jgi:putative ABC transport system permease protein
MKAGSKIFWLAKMALRDSRKNRSRLFIFISSIVLGISALVAIRSFGDGLEKEISSQAKSLLGADLVLTSIQPLDSSAQSFVDSLNGKKARENSFASMVLFPKTQSLRLAQVRALEGDFPFYGRIETIPTNDFNDLQNGPYALVDQTLLIQFNAKPGDSIQIGNLSFKIIGGLEKVPGQAGIAATVAPVIYIPFRFLDQTGLAAKGSRINYKFYYKFDNQIDVNKLTEKIKVRADKENLSVITVETTKERTTDAYSDLASYLNLVAFVALLLGCLGVASSVHTYVKEKLGTVAILRCLGVKGKEAFLIYLLQISFIGLAGSLIGTFLGTLIQLILPAVLGEFLLLDLEFSISWPAIFLGIITGLGVSVLFALLPLLSIRKVSPLYTLRASYESDDPSFKDPARWMVYFLIIAFIYTFSWWQINNYKSALVFTAGITASFLLLGAVALLNMKLVKRFFPSSWPYPFRQGLANLFRPNNQSLVLVISIGLGTTIIASLYFIQSLLLNQLSIDEKGNRANMILFDIQPSQKDKIAEFTKANRLPILQLVPMVTMRLEDINGKRKDQFKKDSLPDWVFNREYRVTFRDTLSDTEKLIQGKLGKKVTSPSDTIFISMDEGYAKTIHVKIGDHLTFNVQGAIIPTVIGSLRKIDWKRIQSNFQVLFPSGVLESAPQFYVLATRTNSREESAQFQLQLVKKFPNISIVDLTHIIKTVKEVLEKVSFVIRFMALFSIITGLLVLIGSIMISRFQRIKESILLRTLGASKKQILLITTLEYFFLGSIAAITGISLALLASWAFARFALEFEFSVYWPSVFVIYLATVFLTVLVGILNSRGILNKSPLEILREQG